MKTLPILTRGEKEIIPESEKLYEAYLVPDKDELIKLGYDEALAEKIIYRVIDGGETRAKAAKPICYNLVELCNEAGLALSPMITTKLDTHGFYLLRLCCSFISHDGSPHPYIWGEMRVKFTNASGSGEPQVFELIPSEILDGVTVKKEYGLSPTLKFGPIEASTGNIFKKIVEFTDLVPMVTSFGKLTTEAGWQYTKSSSRQDIRGNREGFMIVMFPKEVQLRVTVNVRAKVKEKWTKRLTSYSNKWKQEDFSDIKDLDLPLYKEVPVTPEELREKRFTNEFGDLIQNRQELSEADKSIILPPFE
jgi:hypothetical protein